MTAGVSVAREKPSKSKSQESKTIPPAQEDESEDVDGYDHPVKLPLWFKQKLERISQRINQARKRKDPSIKKLPLGYPIVQQLTEWINRTDEELDQEEGGQR